MTQDEKAIAWLDSFDCLSFTEKTNILDLFMSPKDMFSYATFAENKKFIVKYSSQEKYDILVRQIGEEYADKVVKDLDELGIKFITKFSVEYPNTLRAINTPPIVIYYKGNISLLKTECFGVVGTRHISVYGKSVTEKFVRGLVDAGFTIVSGLASGVDTCAHTSTLSAQGKTIGVLAGGIDVIYPASNTMLAKKMVDEGNLIISEVRPTRRPESYMFPIRNRIISALSRGILATEAQEQSGVLHTKNYALEYGKDMFAVPGNITSVTSAGTNRMIVNGQAKCVTDITDILDEYKIVPVKKKVVKAENVSVEENLVLELLKKGEKNFQELADGTGIEIRKLNSLLTKLSINGIIKKLAGNVYFLV